MVTYTIQDHKHRFCAWAASRAASVKNCRFDVADGKRVIEVAGLSHTASNPDDLPDAPQMDATHRQWRNAAISAARGIDLNFIHGIAAKLVNCYLKSMIVCGGHDLHPKAAALHPPIDRLLLDELYVNNVGGLKTVWRDARKQRWSKFSSDQYESVISAIRQAMGGAPLWQVENHWRGHQ